MIMISIISSSSSIIIGSSSVWCLLVLKVLLGIRLLGITFWCGLSNHQAATARMHSVEKTYRRVPTPLRRTSPFSDLGGFKGSATKGQFRKCALTVVPQLWPNENKARVCNKAPESKQRHLSQIYPLPWTLNFQSEYFREKKAANCKWYNVISCYIISINYHDIMITI